MNNRPKRVFLVRHGATAANLASPNLLQGCRTDLPLTEIGFRQAEAASRALSIEPIRFVFSSPLTRAVETAGILARPHSIPVQMAPGLIECDIGQWEGLSWEQVRERDPKAYSAFHSHPGTVPYVGGESFQQVQARAVPAIVELARATPPGDLICVTHNVVARVIIADLLKVPIDFARKLRVDNCGITVLAVDTELRLVTLNRIDHLRELVEW